MNPGLNTEVHRRGRVVHIQTESTGEPPNIITHVFVGGSVVASIRSELNSVAAGSSVAYERQQMLRQHRTVHHRVEHGELDGRLLIPSGASSSHIPLARETKASDESTEG